MKTLPIRARRMDSAGLRVTSMTADSREPSGSRRSSCGLAESKGREERPEYAPRIWMSSMSSSSVSATGSPLASSAVGVADEDLVVAVDVDVLDLGVVEQRLQTPDAEERGVHGGRVLLLGLGVQRRTPGVDLRTGVLLQYLGYHRAGVVPLVLVGHRRDAGDLVEAALLGDTVTGLLPEPLDQLVVDRCHRPAPAVG